MKSRFFLIVSILFFFLGAANAETSTESITSIKPISELTKQTSIPATLPQNVDFLNCTKFFKLDNQKLFYLTLSAISANRFHIDEIQAKSSYVLFTAAKKQFLAGVITIDSQNSMLKITPCDNSYIFPIGIVQNIFRYIELNFNTPIEKLRVL